MQADRAASEQEREEAAYKLLAKTRELLADERQGRLSELQRRQAAEAELDAARATTDELRAAVAAATVDADRARTVRQEVDGQAEAQLVQFEQAERWRYQQLTNTELTGTECVSSGAFLVLHRLATINL